MPSRVLLDVGIDLGVGAFEIGVGHQAGAAVAGADDVDHVEVALADEAVPVDIEEVEAGGGAPVAEQARLDVVEGERALEQGIVFQVDLADGEIVGRAPVGVHAGQHFRRERGETDSLPGFLVGFGFGSAEGIAVIWRTSQGESCRAP